MGATLGTEGCTLEVECSGRSCLIGRTGGTADTEKLEVEVEWGANSPRNGKCEKQILFACLALDDMSG